jgi:hypothetical protein
LNPRERVLALLDRAKQKLGVNGDIRLALYPMKRKITPISFKTNTDK